MDDFPIDELLIYIDSHSGIICKKNDIHILDFARHPYGWTSIARIGESFNRLYLVSHSTTFQEEGKFQIVGLDKKRGHVYPENTEYTKTPQDVIFEETDLLFDEIRQESETYIDYQSPEIIYFMDSGEEWLGLVEIKPVSPNNPTVWIMVRNSNDRKKTYSDYYVPDTR